MGKLDQVKDLDDFGFRLWKALAHKLGGDVEILKHILRGNVDVVLQSSHLTRIHEYDRLHVEETRGFGHFDPVQYQDTYETISLDRSNNMRVSASTAAAEVLAYEYNNQARVAVRDLFITRSKLFTEEQVMVFCRDNPALLSESNLFLTQVSEYKDPLVINVTKAHGVFFWPMSKGQILFPDIHVFFLK